VTKVKQNSERVLYRQELFREKLRKAEDESTAAAKHEQKRLEKPSAIATKVPYYNSIQNSKSDIHKMMIARMQDKYEEDTKHLKDFQHGSKKLHCFTNERVFSDLRFRLGYALHEAGVARSEYAKELIRQLVP